MVDEKLEGRIQEILRWTQEQYQSMNALADQMLENRLTTDQWHETAQRLRVMSETIELSDRENLPLKTAYRSNHDDASVVVKQLTEQLATLMQTFLFKISRLEQQTVKSKESLLPQIHTGAKAAQMRNAYGNCQ